MGNSICMYFLVKCTQLFSRFHSQIPRINLPSCIQIPIALSFADVPCGVPSLLCFAITGPVIAIRMPQHAPTPSTALARPEFSHRNHQHSLGQSLLDLLHRTSATLPTSNCPKAMRTQSRLSEQDDCLSISHVGDSRKDVGLFEVIQAGDEKMNKLLTIKKKKEETWHHFVVINNIGLSLAVDRGFQRSFDMGSIPELDISLAFFTVA